MEFLELRSEVVKVLDESAEFTEKNGYTDALESIRKSKEKLNKNELIVLVCGEMKRGKSSLLCALLEEPDLFPVDVNVATNTVTIIRYGELEKIEVVLEKGGKLESLLIKREDIPRYVTEQENKNNIKQVKCLYIETPNPKLKNGLVFVDTPGVGSLNIEHSEITYGYLPNADVVLFVSDAINPLTDLELKFLKSANEHCDNIIFPLTKIDISKNYEVVRDSNIQKISEYTSLVKDEIVIVPVSNLAKLRYLETNSVFSLKRSNYQELEKIIWSTINSKRARILFVPPLMKLTGDLLKIEDNIKIQYETLKQDADTAKVMEEDLRLKSEQRQMLLENSAEWKSQLDYDLGNAFDNALIMAQDNCQSLQSELTETLKNPAVINNLQELTAKVNESLYIMTINIKSRISEVVNEIVDNTEKKLGLNIAADDSFIEGIYFDKNTDIDIEIAQKSRFDKAVFIGRSMATSGSGAGALSGLAGGILGATIGLLVGGPVGAVAGAQLGLTVVGGLGAALGGGKGLIDGVKQMNSSDIPQISRIYLNYLNQKSQSIKSMILKAKSDMKFAIQSDLNNQIKAQRNMIEKNIRDIHENLSLTKAEAMQKSNTVKANYNKIKVIAKTVEDLMQVIKMSSQSVVRTASKINPEKSSADKCQLREEQKMPQKNKDSYVVENTNRYHDL